MKRIYGWFLVLAVGALVVGCGKETTIENAPLSEKGDTQLNVGKIPDDFPSDVPVYKNIRSAKAITGGVRLLHLQSGDSKSQIVEFYKKELAAAQWQLTVENRSEGVEILAAKQQRNLTVSIVDKGATGRVIDISY